MKLGLNLSFAIKRWLGGDAMAHIVKDELGFDVVQFTWDLVDPWWPAEMRDPIAREYAVAFRRAGITIESTFGGLASYTYNHLLAPTPELRALGKEHLKHAIDMTSEMEVRAAGMPFGSFSSADALDPSRREAIYKEAVETYLDISRYAKEKGLETLYVEPVPLATEFPSSATDALRLMKDLNAHAAIPVRLMVDWGHALFTPLFGEQADMDYWMKTCGEYIGAFHIQQSDGLLDRHWNFTHDGIITPAWLAEFWKRHKLTHQTYFMEIIYPFEETDENVLADMKASVALLRQAA
ncbi:sugar phosphate isomerase/epimerase [Mesorhizobium sp. BAC0120]|uniref:sugar phosphate isomerase/epimerase family protein n=1 Tax=Mesorhizobium sp. BAC0120 TaxID=3090670 RepID=UPI00298CA757|nr:sugar phosphate isomerase/epimerase [Mesorhizobium sp. BAC0120]MDW6021416.1 sugar phosphate isomerase/epimerase [Mesorhizobium sp. BAC0120]